MQPSLTTYETVCLKVNLVSLWGILGSSGGSKLPGEGKAVLLATEPVAKGKLR